MVVPVDSTESNPELFIQLRNTFLENLNTNGNFDDYEECDIERIRTDDNYLKRFIRHKRGRLEDALEMADESLRWRKSFGVKDVTMTSIPLEFFQAKAVFPYNKDKEGNPIIMILVRYHKKAPEFAKDLRRFVIYWVELMEEQTNGGHMTVIMSCEGAGLSNLDLDLIKFLITLFRSYYPDSLAHILIYEMPWILNPAWKIIKAWLPEDFVDKIKFVNKKSIRDYVDESALPLEMDGTDASEYQPPTEEEFNNAKNNAERHVPTENGVFKPGQVVITDDYAVVGGILKISPATHLVFDPQNLPSDCIIQLTCIAEKNISFKVKTTNIESYRVKPALGIIKPGNTVEVSVVLLQGFHPQPSDKFLIMAMEVSESAMSNSSLNTMWKSTPSSQISDHKLKCVVKKEDWMEEGSELERSLKNINTTLTRLQATTESMHANLNDLRMRQNILLCLVGFLFVLIFSRVFLNVDSFWSTILDKLF